MPYNLKRGFHRVFAVITVLWVLLCAVYPMWAREQFFNSFEAQHAQMRINCEGCPEYLSGSACVKSESDCKTRIDELDRRMFQENPLREWYAHAWPFIIAFGVVVPSLAYGAMRGIVAVVLWVRKGFQESSEARS